MASLYYTPVNFGIHDLTAAGESGSFGLRVYYPSDEEGVEGVAIRPDDYPLLVFAHGDRVSERNLCPPERSEDYKRWGAVLHLLARCGFVVAVPAVHDLVNSPAGTAMRIEDTVRWMRNQWVGRATIHFPLVLTDATVALRGNPAEGSGDPTTAVGRSLIPGGRFPPVLLGPPTPLGLIGHSWGARGCALVAAGGRLAVAALAGVAGTWDDNEAITALTTAEVPNMHMVGTNDQVTLSFMTGLWSSLKRPKHQAAVLGLGHWDWFGPLGGIQPCDHTMDPVVCPAGWQIASELLLGFMTKYAYGHWWRPPYLLGSPGRRPPLIPWFEDPNSCALKVRWDDPTAPSSLGNPGETTVGDWTEASPW